MELEDLHYLAQLETEQRNPATLDIDQLSTRDLVSRLHAQNYGVAAAVETALDSVSLIVEKSVERMERGGRLFYIGAGTSGRLGVLDASECPPTFGVPPELVQGIIAGGDIALRSSVESTEDEPDQGARDIIGRGVSAKDVVIGIAASGRTPYVAGALDAARSAGAVTCALVNVSKSILSRHAEFTIEVVTGPEALTGSTRLKAGTAQKMVLNLITTAVMVRLGKAYSNLMVDVKASNVKLVDRAIRIVSAATGIDKDEARHVLEQTEWQVKPAIVVILTGCTSAEAESALQRGSGHISTAITERSGV